jgi:hypothetical protein
MAAPVGAVGTLRERLVLTAELFRDERIVPLPGSEARRRRV